MLSFTSIHRSIFVNVTDHFSGRVMQPVGCVCVCVHVHFRILTLDSNAIRMVTVYTAVGHQGGYILYAGGSIAGVSGRRRWPPPTTLALTTLVAQCELSGR